MLKNKIGKIPDLIFIIQACKALLHIFPDLNYGRVPIHAVKVKNYCRWIVMHCIKNT
jgi:hypothetical protein